MFLFILFILTHSLHAGASAAGAALPAASAGKAREEVSVDVGAFTIGTPKHRFPSSHPERAGGGRESTSSLPPMRRQQSVSTAEIAQPSANAITSLTRMASQDTREKILINPSERTYRCYLLALDGSRIAVTITRPLAYLSATLGSIALALGATDSYLPQEYIPDGFKTYCLRGSIICFSVSGIATALSATFSRSISSTEQWLDDVNKFRQQMVVAPAQSNESIETSSQDSH